MCVGDGGHFLFYSGAYGTDNLVAGSLQDIKLNQKCHEKSSLNIAKNKLQKCNEMLKKTKTVTILCHLFLTGLCKGVSSPP